MNTQTSFKRLILRAVLRKVSPMVIRVLALPDYLTLADFDEVFFTLLGWDGSGFSIHIHGQEFTSFLRRAKVQRTTLRKLDSAHRDISLYLRRHRSLGMGGAAARLGGGESRR